MDLSLNPDISQNQRPWLQTAPIQPQKLRLICWLDHMYILMELDIIIIRCSNNYGPYQFPEKLIPLMITNALEDRPLPVYGDGMNIRDWIHVEDHCRAILRVLEKEKKGEVYNIGGSNE